jgi:hypothetical protein
MSGTASASMAESPHPVATATSSTPPQVAVIGQDGHLFSQEAMLETLAAIRNRRREGSSSEPGQG